MNRKNVILLAVLVNAGLLLVLFLSAITSQEELAIAPTHEISSSSSPAPAIPLFNEEIELCRIPESPALPVTEMPVVHSLPKMIEETPPPPMPTVQTPSSARVAVQIAEVTVKSGDTLEKIAKEQRTTVDEIIRVNQLHSTLLRVGQVLRLPPAKSPLKEAEYYTIKVGDNPWTIAMKHHLKVEELLKLNGLNEERARKLKPGDRLRIR